MRKKISLLLVGILSMGIFVGCSKENVEDKKEITISIAASLVDPINEIIDVFEEENNVKVNVNSGGSGTLKQQITSGAEVDVFFSANEKYMDELIEEGYVDAADKINPISNALVLIKSEDANTIDSIEALSDVDGSIALGELSTVPAGQYAETALKNIGVWDKVEDNIVYAKDVTAVKNYVEKSEVDYGFVYRSDALDLENSEVILEVPNEYYGTVVYALATLKDSENKELADKFIETINSNEGKEILVKYGFVIEE